MENWYALMENKIDVFAIFPSRILANIAGKTLIDQGLVIKDEAFTCPISINKDTSFTYHREEAVYFK